MIFTEQIYRFGDCFELLPNISDEQIQKYIDEQKVLMGGI